MNELKVERLSDIDLDEAMVEGRIRDTGFRRGYFKAVCDLLAVVRLGHPRFAEFEAWVGRVREWRESAPDGTEPPLLPSL